MVRHTHLFWGGRTEWASNLVCSSQHGFVGQLCFPILQKWKVNDTECEIKRKEKSMAVKERYAFSNLEITCAAFLHHRQGCKVHFCLLGAQADVSAQRLSPGAFEKCRLSHSGSGGGSCQRGRYQCPSVVTPHLPSWAEAGGNSQLCQGDCTGYSFRHLFPSGIKTLQSNNMDF